MSAKSTVVGIGRWVSSQRRARNGGGGEGGGASAVVAVQARTGILGRIDG